jgi:hypothetical protein
LVQMNFDFIYVQSRGEGGGETSQGQKSEICDFGLFLRNFVI